MYINIYSFFLSGALGYFSVDGVTDLSVVIRTIVVEDNRTLIRSPVGRLYLKGLIELTGSWIGLSIGAGGAITWLSDREKEWDEVLTKVKSVVGTMDDVE